MNEIHEQTQTGSVLTNQFVVPSYPCGIGGMPKRVLPRLDALLRQHYGGARPEVLPFTLFDFDEATRQMRLTAMMPWTSVEQVLSKMEFEPLIADKIERMEPPTDEELNVIRTLLDPGGLAVSRGEWITIDRATGQRAA